MTARREFLVLRLEGPLQAWGTVAIDPVRPTSLFPTRSGLAGLLGSALGFTYRDGQRTTDLQDAIRFAVREDRPAQLVRDFQTADLERIGRQGWTRWGVERRGGGTAASDNQLLYKRYLADGAFTVALTLESGSPVGLDDLELALRHPARPLFLGRKGCPPASPIFVGRLEAESPYRALSLWPLDPGTNHMRPEDAAVWVWYADGDGPDIGEPETVWNRRDFVADRFTGSELIRKHTVSPPMQSAAR